MFKFVSFCFFLFLSFSLKGDSLSVSVQLKEAEGLYDQGNYKKAIELYENLVSKGKVSGELLFNLGNAYFRNEEQGKAIAAFLGAKKRLPRDPDILHNLKYAHSHSKDKLSWEVEGGSFSILTKWTKNFTSDEVASVLLWILFFSLLFLILTHFVSSFQSFRGGLRVFFGFFLFAYVSVLFSSSSQGVWGAVIAEEAKVQSGPDESNTVLFELHEGAPVLVRDSQKSWYKISLSDGKKGWIQSERVLFF